MGFGINTILMKYIKFTALLIIIYILLSAGYALLFLYYDVEIHNSRFVLILTGTLLVSYLITSLISDENNKK